jgi:hydrogenase-4 component E
MASYSIVLSALILLSGFLLVASKRIRSYIAILQLQGILLALNTGLAGIVEIREHGRIDVLIITLVIIALKVWYIPRALHKTYAGAEYKVEKDFFLNIPALILVCCAIVVFTYFSVSAIDALNQAGEGILLVNSISLVLIGLFFIISRKKAIGQIVGLLAIENGIFITAMYASNGMPFIIDMGVFVDLITAVLILTVMVFRINTAFESIDTDKMKNLRG